MSQPAVFSPAQAMTRLADGNYARLIDGSIFDIGFYKPDGHDPQKPHLRDEAYVIASGSGDFICNGESKAFAPGDLFFVPAGMEHRFVNFTGDFSTWVLFFGARAEKT